MFLLLFSLKFHRHILVGYRSQLLQWNSSTMCQKGVTMLQVPTSWYSSVHEPCTYTGAQPNGSASHLQQRIDRPSTSGSSMGGGPIYSPSVPEFGTQRGLISMPQGQLGQCQGIHRDGDAEQESQTQFDTQNPLVSLGSTKSCSLVTTRQSKVHSLRSEVHGERSVQGPYCSSSSSGVEPSPFNTLSANANEGLDNSLFLQGGASCPPKVVRSFTKVGILLDVWSMCCVRPSDFTAQCRFLNSSSKW